MPLDADSLERLVPELLAADDVTGRATLALHLERYRFAARYLRPGRLLDIACGVGYGTRLLADEGEGLGTVLGVDLSADAVAYARRTYGNGEGGVVSFEVADAMTFSDAEGFDSIVSLETFEHLPDPVGFAAHLGALLRPQGVLVASVPTTPSVDVNPHHLHDFSERSFASLFSGLGLERVAALRQIQPFAVGTVVRRREARLKQLRPNLPRYYATHPGALLRRLWSTLRHGFTNRYLTIAWRRPARGRSP